ncbi:MAG: cytochrome c oxidase assembly protein subunit 15 [Psychromonas sp.]|jgi:cytochrome c oxidase assembly protein subunit 15|uniref:COX15/CtaA family protein n=1 Tax=Psychromonas sp. TaxID=1884585 RepID=UPI0039E313EB
MQKTALNNINNRYKKLVLLSCLLSVVVVGLGAYTRLSDAGLGCPDWPGCYGFLTVPAELDASLTAKHSQPGSMDLVFESAKAWKEMIHRYFAGTLGLLLLAILLLPLFNNLKVLSQQSSAKKNRSAGALMPFKLPALLVVLVLFQAFLGMLTVTMQLQPLIVMGHLLGGFAILSLVTLLYLRLGDKASFGNGSGVQNYFSWCLGALFVLLIQIALGGWLAANYAAPFCAGLPLCSGGWNDGHWQQSFSILEIFQLPSTSSNYEYGVLSAQARMSIHLLHRFWAIITAVTLLAVAIKIYCLSQSKKVKNSALLVMLMVICQVLLGVSLVYWTFPISIALAHNLTAAMLLLSLIRLTYYVKLLPLSNKTAGTAAGFNTLSGEK